MEYKCHNCGYASQEAVNCPTCNVPLEESSEEYEFLGENSE